jgi:hypothetical protein
VRNHLSEGIQLAALRHTEMAGELATNWVKVSSAAESVLGRSPDEIFHIEVVGELVAEFQRLEERCLRLERPATRICDLLLGPPHGRARLARRLDVTIGQLRAELAAHREADTELEALRTSVVLVQDSVLDNIDGSCSLVVSLSTVVELLEGRINIVAANGVHWGT